MGTPLYSPDHSRKPLSDVFAQDAVALTPKVKLTLGLKLEDDPYTGLAPLPSVRLSWKPSERLLLWGAVSRAVRAPTDFDVNLHDVIIPGILVLQGNKAFQTEKLTAFELGARAQLGQTASISVSTFFNDYDDLRSTEWLNMDVGHLPLLWAWGNMMHGKVYGVEAWAEFHPTAWWTLNAGVNLQHEDLSFTAAAPAALNNLGEAGDDPNVQASLRSSVRLGPHLAWSADLRYVGALPHPEAPAYAEADTRIAWDVTDRAQISIAGANLLNPHHLEYLEDGATVGTMVQRSFSVGTRIRF